MLNSTNDCVKRLSTAQTGAFTGFNTAEYNPPERLMTTEEYHSKLEAMTSGSTFGTFDSDFSARLDRLTAALKESIIYNTDDIKPSANGTTYYVSPTGDDNNDGKSPETAWLTLQKVCEAEFEAGDVLLFERGGEYRGWFSVRSDFKVGAYGTGHKPKIICAQSAASLGGWEKTEAENIWKLKAELSQTDLGHILYYLPDGQEICGDKVYKLSSLKNNYSFIYNGATTQEEKRDNLVYIYYDGDPNKDFVSVELPYDTKVILAVQYIENCEINNLNIVHGRGPFWPNNGGKNIYFTYCISGWCGGFANQKNTVRYGGGSGVWFSCDTFVYDHCWFYQQFDSGVSPQYDCWHYREDPALFKDFKTVNCVFETTEYSLEYFCTQPTSLENGFKNMYFSYNICRDGGRGFGDKPFESAYIKSWYHENPCFDCKFEYNIFDRAEALSLEIVGHAKFEGGKRLSFNHIPKLNKNIYIQKENHRFAKINNLFFFFNTDSIEKLINLGIDTDSRYLFEKE